MDRWIGVGRCVCVLLLWNVGQIAAEEPEPAAVEGSAVTPFFSLREHPSLYHGTGRDRPEPEAVDEVRIAFFGPSDPDDPDAGDLWSAAQLAIDQANAGGGYDGRPFRLVPAWSDDPWGSGATQLVRLVYDQPVWAILGGIDGPTAHLAAQIVGKARLPLVSPSSSDKSVNLANVPWVYSLLPGDHSTAPPLADALADRLEAAGDGRLVVLSADDHDTHHFTRELLTHLARRHRVTPRLHLQCRAGAADVGEHARRAVAARPDALALLADPSDSARLVRAVRAAGYAGTIFGSAAMGRRRFAADAGPAADGAVFPRLFAPSEQSREFVQAFEVRRGHPPDYAAAHAYDAARLLVAAIRRAGLNRARINDALRELSPWTGVTGTVAWDPLGSNTRPVQVQVPG